MVKSGTHEGDPRKTDGLWTMVNLLIYAAGVSGRVGTPAFHPFQRNDVRSPHRALMAYHGVADAPLLQKTTGPRNV
jgi:hypothetical protein